MNPIKADKIQFGSTANVPHITRGDGTTLTFFDPNVGTVNLSTLISERLIDDVKIVASSTLGADYTSIQDAHDALPLSGGTIIVYQGEYSETLTFTKPVHIIGRGRVIIQATDLDVATITDTSVTFENLILKSLTQLGNNQPYLVVASSSDVSDKVTLKGVTLDTSEHLTANFISATTAQIISQVVEYVGAGSISCEGANGLYISGASAPDIDLTDMVTQSLISCASIGEISLVASSLVISGKYVSCVGDINSEVWSRSFTGTVGLVNTDQADIEFPCPISEGSYSVLFENTQSGEIPVVTVRDSEGFSISLGNPITETLRWSITL